MCPLFGGFTVYYSTIQLLSSAVLQQLKLISESLKVLVAEAGRQQSQINQLEEELSSMNDGYKDLKEDVAHLGIESSSEACTVVSEAVEKSLLKDENLESETMTSTMNNTTSDV